MRGVLLLSLVLLGLGIGWTAEMTYTEAMSGKPFPLTLKMKELGKDWCRFTCGDASHGSLNMAAVLFRAKLGTDIATYYTKGQSVTIAGQTYLVAYTRPPKTLDLRALGGDEPVPLEPVTGETALTLALLNLRTAGSLLDIRPFDLAQEITAGKAIEKAAAAERLKERQTTTANNLKQLTTAALIYAQDHEETLPDNATWQDNLHIDKAITRIPGTDIAYTYNPFLSGKSLGEIANPQEMILFYEPVPWPDGRRCAGYLDGHVEMHTRDTWERAKRASHLP